MQQPVYHNNVSFVKKKKVIIFCLFFFTVFKVSAQDLCSFYNKILFNIQWGQNHNERPPFFYVFKKTETISDEARKNWLADLIKDSALINNTYNRGPQNTEQCKITLKHKYINSLTDFPKNDFIEEKNSAGTISYQPVKIQFSEILYSNETVVIYVKVKTRYYSNGILYAYIFRKRANNWIIDKRESEHTCFF